MHKIFIDNNLDSMICPMMESPAELYEHTLPDSGIFTTVTSAMNYPAISIPVSTIVEQDVEELKQEMHKRSVNVHKLTHTEEALLKNVDEDAIDLPLSIQIIGLPFSDEMLLAIAKLFEK